MQAIGGAVVFIIGITWTSYTAIYSIVKAEGVEIKREVKQIRDLDMEHLDKRFDRIENLIKEK